MSSGANLRALRRYQSNTETPSQQLVCVPVLQLAVDAQDCIRVEICVQRLEGSTGGEQAPSCSSLPMGSFGLECKSEQQGESSGSETAVGPGIVADAVAHS